MPSKKAATSKKKPAKKVSGKKALKKPAAKKTSKKKAQVKDIAEVVAKKSKPKKKPAGKKAAKKTPVVEKKTTMEPVAKPEPFDPAVKGLKTYLEDNYPEVITEGKLDFDVLKEVLGEFVDENEELYSFTWNGKARARHIAQTLSTGTLRPCPEESIDWDTTQNLFIEGDNLEILKLMQKSYHKRVKMIYIDPPYNTGNDFIYSDDFTDSIANYKQLTGQLDDGGRTLSTNPETSGRYHTNWLNMMYPRLKMARNLLSNEGLIVCHIDEHEFSNLIALMDEVFWPENNLGQIIWDKRNPKGDATRIASQHEYLVVYARNVDVLRNNHALERPKENAERMLAKAEAVFSKMGSRHIPSDLESVVKKYNLSLDLDDYRKPYSLDEINEEYKDWLKLQDVSGGEAAYSFIDESGDIYQSVSMAWPNKQQAPDEYFVPLVHPETGKPCPLPERGWRNPPETMKSLLDKGLIIFGDNETKQPRRKYLLRENMDENIPSVVPFGGSDDALMKNLGITFDNPKPLKFAKTILKYFLGNNEIVIDFFAGSGTTAHACIDLNLEQEAQHNYIMVQLPEQLDPKKKEQKAAFKFCKDNKLPTNIAEIGKERIRRAVAKTKEEHPEYDGDLGFKVFKLDSSNIKTWDTDFEHLEDALLDAVENIKSDRDEEDVLYELLLKYGLDLTTPIEKRQIDEATVHIIKEGTLIVCLADDISLGVVEGIAALKDELNPDVMQVVFSDRGFADDVVKTNAVQILRQAGIDNLKSL